MLCLVLLAAGQSWLVRVQQREGEEDQRCRRLEPDDGSMRGGHKKTETVHCSSVVLGLCKAQKSWDRMTGSEAPALQ